MKAWTFMILRNPVLFREAPILAPVASLDQEAAERTLVAVDDPEAPVAAWTSCASAWPCRRRSSAKRLILVGAGGFAYEEAAEICGCAVGTVKSRVSRTRRALQAILEGWRL